MSHYLPVQIDVLDTPETVFSAKLVDICGNRFIIVSDLPLAVETLILVQYRGSALLCDVRSTERQDSVWGSKYVLAAAIGNFNALEDQDLLMPVSRN
ncbi:MAG TPA: hypothetical protein VKU01_19690 [Bryobacteraceae bacterium]|nr:hypothetical protein [Bryobacteraceae bacterium]